MSCQQASAARAGREVEVYTLTPYTAWDFRAQKNNQVPEAKVAFERSLAERGPGCRSIYRLADVKRALRETSTGKN
jgi:hypothetical protein